MSLIDHLPHPGHCFCQIPLDELEAVYQKHYEDGVSTRDLLAVAKNDHEREVICIVAMFELEDEAISELMGDVNLPEHHIIHCRDQFRKMLRRKAHH